MFQVDLPPEVESRLYEESVRQGVPASDIARRLIEEHLPETEPKEMTWGEKVAATLKEIGPIWQDRPESSEELARKFREEAERRGPHPCA